MWNPSLLLIAPLATLLLVAQPAPVAMTLPVPVLQPGEGLALTLGDGEVHTYGEAQKVAPMGSLALLVWMRLEGSDWASQSMQFKCTGTSGTLTCSKRAGHGKVDLGKALREDCNLAFLSWIAQVQVGWKADYGEATARVRLEEVFAPFPGRRLPQGEGLPVMTSAWVGDGDLLRTSPEAFLRWLMEPEQSGVLTFGKRYLAGFWVDFRNLMGQEDWWFKLGTHAMPGEPGATCTWVAGGRGMALVVLYLPHGLGKEEARARIRKILGEKG
jgi:hypothetical protein